VSGDGLGALVEVFRPVCRVEMCYSLRGRRDLLMEDPAYEAANLAVCGLAGNVDLLFRAESLADGSGLGGGTRSVETFDSDEAIQHVIHYFSPEIVA
jgi:hypothetical protein